MSETGSMLRAVGVLAEDLGLVPGTHTCSLQASIAPVPGDLPPSFSTESTRHTHGEHTYMQEHSHMKKNSFFK